jgi:transposase
MKYITGQDRTQIPLFTTSLDQAIDQGNEVRLIDMFVDTFNLADFGFKVRFSENGRPAYLPSDLLKLFMYGYLNRIRSSRALEKECRRNIELMWLLKCLVPDHNTIANFRKDNPKAIRKVFRATVQLAAHFNLIGGKLIAGDSTKLRAQNSKKNNFNPAKIERHIAYIDAKLEEYSTILAKEDKDDLTPAEKDSIQAKIKKHKSRKAQYLQMQQQLDESGDTQISASDPDSRQLITRNNITEVAYNVQTTVDAKHCLTLDYKVTNVNDSKAMGNMVRRAKTVLQKDDFTALFDKGYHTGSEFDYVNKLGVEVLVAAPDVASHAPDQAFDVENFMYDKQRDLYICPANQTLTTNGNWYNKSRGKSVNKIKQYKSVECKTCPYFSRCTVNKSGRMLERSEHAELIENNKLRLEQNKDIYRKRQAIVEHTYGIFKRQWDFYYVMTKKSIKHASADVGLIFVALNFRRILNIVGTDKIKALFKSIIALIKSFSVHLSPIKSYCALKRRIQYFRTCSNVVTNFPNFIQVIGLNTNLEVGF